MDYVVQNCEVCNSLMSMFMAELFKNQRGRDQALIVSTCLSRRSFQCLPVLVYFHFSKYEKNNI
jgi:hypothetical protein